MPKKIRTCIVCGKEFFGKYPGRRGNLVCSEECRRQRISESKMKGQYIRCEECEKEFWVSPSRLSRGVKYCSRECQERARKKKRIKKTCEECGAEYIVTQSHQESRYCSVACYDKAQINRVKVNCTICGKELERTPSQAARSNAALCSEECIKKYFLERIVFFQSRTNTKPERMFNEQTPKHINRTSGGQFYINFSNGKVKNPDFIVRPVNKTKQVIEIFGRYWHKPEEEAELIEKYRQAGYDCLVLWEDEVYKETYQDKLRTFLDKDLCRLSQ